MGYEVFAGNMHDSLTVKSIVESLERKHGAKYIVGTPKAMLRQFERHLTDQNWVVAQEGVAPRTLLYEFAKIKSGDIVLPAESAGGVRTAVRLRHVTEPEAEQQTLLHRLGLILPRRLKRLDSPAQME